MSEPQVEQPTAQQAQRPLSLIPVGLKEAALDSPTFRATTVHFTEQVEAVEKWLEGYLKSTGKLVHEVSTLEDLVNGFLARAVPPASVSEAVLDHDYTLLAMRRHGEGFREFWSHIISTMKKMEATVIEPIRAFLSGELRYFKESRRYLELNQKGYDSVVARFAAQSKAKEPSSLREDAFQLHESRKAYLKASLEFCVIAPQVRFTLDKLLVKMFSDQWRDLITPRETQNTTFDKWAGEMERIRSWSHEMEAGERAFKRELQTAKKSIEEAAEVAVRPSRELEDYSSSTVPYLGSKGPSTVNLHAPANHAGRSEKQGWLFIRTITGKPTRTVWVRRWFFVNNGIFGWLVQGLRSGGVEESERTGVLLCNIKPAVQEERRFCFEVKTKDSASLLQAETQAELLDWLDAFDLAKRKALEDTGNAALQSRTGVSRGDAAFAISLPSVPEFAANYPDGHAHHGSDELAGTNFDRSLTLSAQDRDTGGGLVARGSFDVSIGRRLASGEKDSEGGKDHAARIIQKLDLHRKPTSGSQMAGIASGIQHAPTAPAGGIASLISASHNVLPVYSAPATNARGPGSSPQFLSDLAPLPMSTSLTGATELFKGVPLSTLAPPTLAAPPATTNLSKSAVIVSAERGIDAGRVDKSGGMPSGLMANLWGSSNWGHVIRLERGEVSLPDDARELSTPSSAIDPVDITAATAGDENRKPMPRKESDPPPASGSTFNGQSYSTLGSHRRSASLDVGTPKPSKPSLLPDDFPLNYPPVLKTQDGQFRTIFPNVPRQDRVLLVFRAMWNPNEQQGFPGRVYATANDLYFYSNHLGLVLVSGVRLNQIIEVTAAPGKDCDFLFLHLDERDSQDSPSKVTVKIFLEPPRLLQRRLNILVRNANSEERLSMGALLDALIRAEQEDDERSPSLESWEDVSLNTPIDDGFPFTRGSSHRRERDLRTAIHADNHQSPGKKLTKFKLPSQPVTHEPKGMDRMAASKQFDISTKALFHVMFGDDSSVFQTLYNERSARRKSNRTSTKLLAIHISAHLKSLKLAIGIMQGPWTNLDEGYMRRDFDYQIDYHDMFGRPRQANVVDHQIIEVLDDHVCYVVTDRKTPWHLPHQRDFMLESKIVITYQARSKCKLTIYTKVAWSNAPTFSKGIVGKQALGDLGLDALDLVDVVSDQVRRLGPNSRTKKAILVFGEIGQHTHALPFSASDAAMVASRRLPIKQRTLTHMLWETLGSVLESAVSSLMMWTFSILQKVWEVSSAHGIILSLLGLSVMTNLFYSSRDTSEWWAERNAGKFMSRIGVGPNLIMSKAVYLKDVEEIFANQTELLGEPRNSWYKLPQPHSSDFPLKGLVTNLCTSLSFSMYKNIASATDMDAPYQSAGLPFLEASARATSRRLRRTRQHFGAYRHDLLVAMRVINNVEREILMVEWENWLMDENIRCGQLEDFLRENRTSSLKRPRDTDAQQPILDAAVKKNFGPVIGLLKEHCQSCRREHDSLRDSRVHMAFG
ncbi:MAG: SNF1-interacting protein [Geoglossum umbratile]|nr:MAG: SNF1-interacting protein [Geoglossum umbratile]